MSLVIGIVGLPNVGKSSLFNALTNSKVLSENRPFVTIEPNLGVVNLLDPRIASISEIVKPKKTIYSFVKFLDIAGLVKGASNGEGLGNKFLENIRTVDAICLVVRAFSDSSIFSVNSVVDPVFEAEIVLNELIYSDLETVENILRKLKSNDCKISLFNRIKEHLSKDNLIKNMDFSEEDVKNLRGYQFLTNKPIIVVANSDDLENNLVTKSRSYADSIGAQFLSINVKFENELNSLTDDEKNLFLLSENRKTCLSDLVAKAFQILNLSTFFTVGEQEVRAWTFKTGSSAQECAGIIHSDMKRGFIKAKVVKYEDFLRLKDFKILKQQGKMFFGGKDYLMQDGDIVHFEFNV